MAIVKEKYDSWEYILLGLILLSLSICLVTPLVISSNTFFPFIVGKSVLSRMSIEFAFAFWIILAYRIPEYRPKHSIIIYAFLIWILISLITGFLGVSIQRSYFNYNFNI